MECNNALGLPIFCYLGTSICQLCELWAG